MLIKRQGWILFEYLLTLLLAALICSITVQMVKVTWQGVHTLVLHLHVLDESRFVSMTMNAYLRNATPQTTMGRKNKYRFLLPNGLPHALSARERLYLVLRNGQEQPITTGGTGTAQSPQWKPGNTEEQTLFSIEESGLVRYRYTYLYEGQTWFSETAIIPLPVVYRVGEIYEII